MRWVSTVLFSAFTVGCVGMNQGAAASSAAEHLAELIPTGAGKERCGLPLRSNAQEATVTVRVTVMPNGAPQHVEVTKTSVSGLGLEAAARDCAMNYKYRAARDSSGKVSRAWSREFDILFVELPEYPKQKSQLWR